MSTGFCGPTHTAIVAPGRVRSMCSGATWAWAIKSRSAAEELAKLLSDSHGLAHPLHPAVERRLRVRTVPPALLGKGDHAGLVGDAAALRFTSELGVIQSEMPLMGCQIGSSAATERVDGPPITAGSIIPPGVAELEHVSVLRPESVR